MRQRNRNREIRFEVVDGRLVRTVSIPGGRTYAHRCTARVFEDVARAIDETGELGVTLEPLAEALNEPYTQVNVALEFLKERGCVVTRGRRNYPASNFVFEDAMTEYHALRGAGRD